MPTLLTMRRWALLWVTLVVAMTSIHAADSIKNDRGHDHQEWSLRGSLASSKDLSTQFPTIAETLEMARLSSLVYRFKDQEDSYCANFTNVDGVRCHWYCHDEKQGTQVMIVSNSKKRYLAIVFAGTDDLRTSLQDMHVAKKPFGDNHTVQLENRNIKVHAGFDNAVFSGVFDQLLTRLHSLQLRHPLYRKLYTTGHSLGAADSILTATALALTGKYSVVSINFGCPQTGNREWRDFLSNTTSPLHSKLGIWKVVLGWDLVSRLPEFFDHVGHTIQLWGEDHHKYDEGDPNLVECYYQHYGDAEQGYAGVPMGWNSKPYAWVPGALSYHYIEKYLEYLETLAQKKLWVDQFKTIQPAKEDDDAYNEPPDDWYALDSEYQIER